MGLALAGRLTAASRTASVHWVDAMVVRRSLSGKGRDRPGTHS